jgi:CRP-like cAMP-binding protein
VRNRLRALQLFADLDEEELDRLAAATTELQAPAGRTLITRGEAGSGLFILEEGEAIVESPEGPSDLVPGDVFGERALVGEDIRRTARVRAKTDVRCLAIARTEIEKAIAANTRLADRLRQLSA